MNYECNTNEAVHDSVVLWEYGFIMSYSALKPKWPNIVLAKHCSC